MALIDTMGDAPGFISYMRQPMSGFSALPRFIEPPKPKVPDTKIPESDIKADPGTKQYLHDLNSVYESQASAILNDYGNDWDFAKEDPRWRQLDALTRYHVQNLEAAEQNKEKTQSRTSQLSTKGSGQNPFDLEMQKSGRMFVPREFTYVDPNTGDISSTIADESGRLLTKEKFLNLSENLPVLTKRDDDIIVDKLAFDDNTGTYEDTEQFFKNFFTNLGKTEGGVESGQSTTEGNAEMKFGFSNVYSRDWMNNFEQVQSAVDYLQKYGFNDAIRYSLSQDFYKDLESGKTMKVYDFDENGNVKLNSKKNPVYKDVTLEDIVADENTAYMAFDLYTADRVSDAAQRFKESSYKTKDRSELENMEYDPETGGLKPKVTEQTYWQNLFMQGYKPPGTVEGVTETAVIGDMELRVDETGKPVYGRGSYLDTKPTAIIDEKVVPKNVWTRLESGLSGLVSRVTPQIKVGGVWQDMSDDLKSSLKTGDVLSLTEETLFTDKQGNYYNPSAAQMEYYNKYMSNKDISDEQKSRFKENHGIKTQWVANIESYVDDDYINSYADQLKIFTGGYSGATGETIYDNWKQAETKGIIQEIDRNAVDQDKITSDQQTGIFDIGDHTIYKIRYSIPVKEDIGAGFDLEGGSSTIKNKAEFNITGGNKAVNVRQEKETEERTEGGFNFGKK